MSDSAIITTENELEGIYLHCLGSPDYVFGFLEYCALQGFRPPEKDIYGWARLSQVIGNSFPDGMGVGVGSCNRLSVPFDNGTYIIEDWKVIGRRRVFNPSKEIEDVHVSSKLLHLIDENMPHQYQLGPYLDSVSVPTSSLSYLDLVWYRDFEGARPLLCPVIGFGENGEGRSLSEGDPCIFVYAPFSHEGHLEHIKSDKCRVPSKE